MDNLYRRGTLLFDHLHRRCRKSRGLEWLPPQVLECHEDFTRDIRESMLAKVELIYGDKIHLVAFAEYKFTPLPLWSPPEGVILFLAHEENFRNADARYKFRRICLLVAHPQSLMYELNRSPRSSLHDLIHNAASKMTGIDAKEFYFRQQRWKDQPNYPQTAAQKYLQFDDDSKGMLLDHLAPSNTRPDSNRDRDQPMADTEGGSEIFGSHSVEGQRPDDISEGEPKEEKRRKRKNKKKPREDPSRLPVGTLLPEEIEESVAAPDGQSGFKGVRGPFKSPTKAGDKRSLREGEISHRNKKKHRLVERDEKSPPRFDIAEAAGDRDSPVPFAIRYSAQASAAQKSSDKGIFAALASTLRSTAKPEVANRNPSEIKKGETRKRVKPRASAGGKQWPLCQARLKHQNRLRRPQRDLSMIKVDDMEGQDRRNRVRRLRTRVAQGLQLSDQEQAQFAELLEKPTHPTTVRDLSKIPIADIDSKTGKADEEL
ncbi:hypothetical protein ACLMJK_004400 [Lecanora helva]